MNVEIKVECKGNAVGTLGWLNEMLSNSELVIKNTKSGSPGMFLKTVRGDKEDFTFICKPASYTEPAYEYKYATFSNTPLIYCHVISSIPEEVSFSDYPLTPAAYIKLDEFIDEACRKFAEWWENDGEI